ncbi:MAG: hypothetical protein HKN98_11015 [Silicimonas sp.]|nr:hypothetical protein [Silicimonas sp.]NNF91456.1 hypothetical protein [Boseongicola sp.]RZV98461.1 MAG: hypothetical protein EX266_17495 [Paracoccaceae bacterium]
MAEVLRRDWTAVSDEEASGPRPRVAADWPLMGDILTHRMGTPEHLIRWRRAEDWRAHDGSS